MTLAQWTGHFRWLKKEIHQRWMTQRRQGYQDPSYEDLSYWGVAHADGLEVLWLRHDLQEILGVRPSERDLTSALASADETERYQAVEHLRFLAGPRLPLLARAAADPDWAVRKLVCEELSRWMNQDETAARLLMDMLAANEDNEPGMNWPRVEAAQALGGCWRYAQAAREALERAGQTDPDEIVKDYATIALRRLLRSTTETRDSG
ncbi:MAG: HEAT repeat domain-containing protein [Armatimonadetes bacterium]|nr:HEAT repeat domain-containing protein [Armatimonadota bacterium]